MVRSCPSSNWATRGGRCRLAPANLPRINLALDRTERMNSTRTCALRTRLRDVNIEYSMLVKSKPEEGNSVRMAQLRGERAALMAMLSGERASLSVTSDQTPLNAVTQRSA